MGFPSIDVHDATNVGARCTSGVENTIGHDGRPADSTNSLCPHISGNAARVEIQGAANAAISYTVSAPAEVTSGLRFDVLNNGNTVVANLDSAGILGVDVVGVLTLVNKAEVSSGAQSYSYDFVAAYQ